MRKLISNATGLPMLDNEVILDWLGVEKHHCPMDLNEINSSDMGAWANGREVTWLESGVHYKGPGYDPGTFITVRDYADNDVEIFVVDNYSDDGCVRWEPDYDITLWHGRDGILQKIGMIGYLDFYDALTDEVAKDIKIASSATALQWNVICATPAQLSKALVMAILKKPV